jgi:hypothetical protein
MMVAGLLLLIGLAMASTRRAHRPLTMGPVDDI